MYEINLCACTCIPCKNSVVDDIHVHVPLHVSVTVACTCMCIVCNVLTSVHDNP